VPCEKPLGRRLSFGYALPEAPVPVDSLAPTEGPGTALAASLPAAAVEAAESPAVAGLGQQPPPRALSAGALPTLAAMEQLRGPEPLALSAAHPSTSSLLSVPSTPCGSPPQQQRQQQLPVAPPQLQLQQQQQQQQQMPGPHSARATPMRQLPLSQMAQTPSFPGSPPLTPALSGRSMDMAWQFATPVAQPQPGAAAAAAVAGAICSPPLSSRSLAAAAAGQGGAPRRCARSAVGQRRLVLAHRPCRRGNRRYCPEGLGDRRRPPPLGQRAQGPHPGGTLSACLAAAPPPARESQRRSSTWQPGSGRFRRRPINPSLSPVVRAQPANVRAAAAALEQRRA